MSSDTSEKKEVQDDEGTRCGERMQRGQVGGLAARSHYQCSMGGVGYGNLES